MITAAIRQRLLVLARRALVARVHREAAPDVPADLELVAFGAFVTVYHRDHLRGCLGTLDTRDPLARVIARLAGDVSHRDHRFEPIRRQELPDVTIDLSVLTPPEPVDDPAAIVVGRDGLIIEKGRRRGLLLPQVAPEHGWDCQTFLAQTCLKAGLPLDAWRDGAVIYRFEAEVFGERHVP